MAGNYSSTEDMKGWHIEAVNEEIVMSNIVNKGAWPKDSFPKDTGA